VQFGRLSAVPAVTARPSATGTADARPARTAAGRPRRRVISAPDGRVRGPRGATGEIGTGDDHPGEWRDQFDLAGVETGHRIAGGRGNCGSRRAVGGHHRSRAGGTHGGRARKLARCRALRPTAGSPGRSATCENRAAEILGSARSQAPRCAAPLSAARREPANLGVAATSVADAPPLGPYPVTARPARTAAWCDAPHALRLPPDARGRGTWHGRARSEPPAFRHPRAPAGTHLRPPAATVAVAAPCVDLDTT
jgi:hypothetical protein